MSNSQESVPGIGLPAEECDGDGAFGGNLGPDDVLTADEYAESVKFKAWADQQLEKSKSHLKRSCSRLLELLSQNAPPQMLHRELALLTRRCGESQSALLDCGYFPTAVHRS